MVALKTRMLLGTVALAAVTAGCGSTVSLGALSSSTSTAAGADGLGLGASSATQDSQSSSTQLSPGSETSVGTTSGAITAGPTSSSGSTDLTGPTGGPTTAAAINLSKPIKIGYVVFDTAGFTAVTGNSDAGSSSANQAADHFEMAALLKYANATGGVNGRKIEAVGYRLSTTDALNMNTLESVCAKATEDDKVSAFIDRSFMVSDDLVDCFAKHKTDLVSFLVGTSNSVLDGAAPYVATTQPTIERTAKAFAEGIVKSGYLTKGAVVGIVADEGTAQTAALNTYLLPALKSAGFPAKEVIRTTTTDNSQATSQGSAAVLKMRSSGVTHVVWFANFLSQLGFANAANSQGYKPRYAFSDYAGGAGDAGFYMSPEEDANSIAVSVLTEYVVDPDQSHHVRSQTAPIVRSQATPGLRFCLDTISKYGGRNYYTATDRSTDFQFYCDHFLLWLNAARKAPAPFVEGLFATGVHGLGRSYAATLAHATDFTSRLTGASDYRYGLYADTGCKCWSATSGWLSF